MDIDEENIPAIHSEESEDDDNELDSDEEVCTKLFQCSTIEWSQ